MPYRFATSRLNYSDLASGQVFYSLPGHPAFPIRLASEVFLRCLAHRRDRTAPVRLFDPCCGAAYHLGILAYFHWEQIAAITASDIDPQAVAKARANLGLLGAQGMDRRVQEIADLLARHGKASHRAILESARRMAEIIRYQETAQPLPTRVFQADATRLESLQAGLGDERLEVLITDIPYGLRSNWQGQGGPDPLTTMLGALTGFLEADSILAIAAGKEQRIAHRHYRRVERFQIGKRQVVFLKLG